MEGRVQYDGREGEWSECSHKNFKARQSMEIKTKEIHNRLTKRSSFPGGVNLSLSLLPVSPSFLPPQRAPAYSHATKEAIHTLLKHLVFSETCGGTAVRQAGRLEFLSHSRPSLLLTRNAGTRDPGKSQMTKRKWRSQAELSQPVFLFQRLLAQRIYL